MPSATKVRRTDLTLPNPNFISGVSPPYEKYEEIGGSSGVDWDTLSDLEGEGLIEIKPYQGSELGMMDIFITEKGAKSRGKILVEQ